jgi:7-cyano-7-deazaguanine synthase
MHHLSASGHDVLGLGINYGQRHSRELQAGVFVSALLGLPYRIADLSGIRELIANSSQTGAIEVPEGHYAEASMKQTVVPNRNMILLSVAIGYAVNIGADAVAYGAHAGDHTIYPDCRPEFAAAMSKASLLCDWNPVELLRPFVVWTKADIVRRGQELNTPMGATWSCYKGGKKHCGKCGTCVERREAFQLAGVPDPTEYE